MRNNIREQPQLSTPPVSNSVNTSSHQIPSIVLILLLLFIWPIGLIFVFKDKRYTWIPILLWIFGVLTIIPVLSLLIFVVPQLNKLNETLNIQNTNSVIYLLSGLTILCCVGEIAYGFMLKRKTQMLQNVQLPVKKLIIAFSLFIVPGFLTGVTTLSIVSPIYKVINEIGSSSSENSTVTPSPTTYPTTNWTLYSGTYFSIKYPSNIIPENNPFITRVNFLPKTYQGKFPSFTITVNLNGYPTNRLAFSPKSQVQTVNFNGFSGLRGTFAKGSYFDDTVMLSNSANKNNNRIYFGSASITLTITNYNGHEPIDEKNIFEGMLSTFKFVDQNQTNVLWTTFTDPKERFTFEYPSSWTATPNGYYTPAGDLDKHSIVRLIKPGTLETTQDITVGVYDGFNQLSAYDFLKQYWCHDAVMDQSYNSCVNDLKIHANLNGSNFSVAELLYIIPGPLGPAAWTTHGNYGIFISANNMRYENQNDMKTFSQIISSFKFMN